MMKYTNVNCIKNNKMGELLFGLNKFQTGVHQ